MRSISIGKIFMGMCGWNLCNSMIKSYYFRKAKHELDDGTYIIVKQWYNPWAKMYYIDTPQTPPPPKTGNSRQDAELEKVWENSLSIMRTELYKKIRSGIVTPIDNPLLLPGLSTTTCINTHSTKSTNSIHWLVLMGDRVKSLNSNETGVRYKYTIEKLQ